MAIVDLGPIIRSQLLRYNPGGAPVFWNYYPDQLAVRLLNYSYFKPDTVVNETLVESSSYVNDSDAQQTKQETDSRNFEAEFSLLVQHGIDTKLPQNFEANIPKIGLLDGSVVLNASFAEQQTITRKVLQMFSWDETIPIPPRTRVDVGIYIVYATYDPRLDINIEISGQAGIKYYIKPSNGPPTIRYFFKPIGEVFTQYPVPNFRVLSADKVEFGAFGTLRGKEGLRYEVRTQQTFL